MRFYLVAILSMGLVLLLTVGRVSATDADPETNPKPEDGADADAEGEAEGEAEEKTKEEPVEEPEVTTKATENGCELSILSTFTLVQTFVLARILM